MPPKKKGKTASPVVVGTVSTRSTRRQSVVNIEIPKLTKTRSRKGNISDLKEFPETEHFAEKIKASYSKVVNCLDYKMISHDQFIPKKELQSPISPSFTNTDNKELLQILEDWSDDDSQENKDNVPTEIECKEEKLEYDEKDNNKMEKSIIVSESSFPKTSNESGISEILELKRTLSSVNENLTSDESNENSVNLSEYISEKYKNLVNLNTVKYSSDAERYISSEKADYIPSHLIEETNSLNLSENEELLLECSKDEVSLKGKSPSSSEELLAQTSEEMEVTEEIVSPPSEDMLEESEIAGKGIKVSEVGTYFEQMDVSCQEAEEKIIEETCSRPVSLSDPDSNSNNQIELKHDVNNEEIFQCSITSDSNDSEVRNYFAKEIEKNESVQNVEEALIDNQGGKLTEDRESAEIIENCYANTSDEKIEEEFIPQKDFVQEETIDSDYMEISTQDSDIGNSTVIAKDIEIENIGCEQNVCNPSEKSEICLESTVEDVDTVHFNDSPILEDDENDRNEVTISDVTETDKNDHSGSLAPKTEDALVQKIEDLKLISDGTKRNKKYPTRDPPKTGNNLALETVSKKNKKNVKNKESDSNENTQEIIAKEKLKRGGKHSQKKEKNPDAEVKIQSQKNKTKKGNDSNVSDGGIKDMPEMFMKTSLFDYPVKKTKNITVKPKDKKTDSKMTGKKALPILGGKIKIKLSPKKSKDVAKKNESPEIRKEIVTKNIQREVKKSKEGNKKCELEEQKKLKDLKKSVESDLSEKGNLHKNEGENKSEIDPDDIEVRRSSRIKSISVLKKKTTGHGLVKSKSDISFNESDISDSNSTITESDKTTPLPTPSSSPKTTTKERKTRWSKSLENIVSEISTAPANPMNQEVVKMEIDEKPKLAAKDDPVVQARLKQFVHLKENIYKTSRMSCKEAKKMTCDCFLTEEEIESKEYGCGEDCLNRLLLIECGNFCPVGDRCTNKRFQKAQFAPVEVFNTDKKGLGLRAAANIPFGEFILEYVGEVLDGDEFDKRAEVYSQDKNIHYYFMALRADAIIDATMKGNISRFINHSCDPNAETQKWTVNGELRIGFFSTRTILAGEEITFDYRFQRYGKEAQKCYCGASICRGWLGEEPDEESEEEDEYEEVEVETAEADISGIAQLPTDETMELKPTLAEVSNEGKPSVPDISLIKEEQPLGSDASQYDIKTPIPTSETPPVISIKSEKKIVKKKVTKKKPRVELFEEIDQLNEEIEMLVATGLKNQAHTLKLSRLMVRAQEPQQRTKLLRVLRRGELPCRRLFLDYHGLRLMHGYMIDAQQLVISDKKYESLRLEMLQTLAVLPIPNKTMLQDSKVLPTVEKWASSKELTSPLDSDSNSPKVESEVLKTQSKESNKTINKDEMLPSRSIEDQEEEIRFLATKLLDEWKNLKEVFRIPKKERIEQMKEHEREANKKFMQSGYGQEQERDKRLNELRYRGLSSKYKYERESTRKSSKNTEKYSAEFMKLSKIERRKLFAIQHELKEEERRLKQRELWRQHEMNCMMIGTDPRFTAPFDPSKPYQCIWNPQLGQWQTYPLPQNSSLISPQPAMVTTNLGPPQNPKGVSSYFAPPPLPQTPTISASIQQLPPVMPPSISSGVNISHNPIINQMSTYGGLSNVNSTVLANLSSLTQIAPSNMPASSISLTMSKELKPKEEDPSQVRFMGPIPPPVKLPPKWKCAKDKYGRPYYYHIKIRKSQWEPPSFIETPVVEEAEFSQSESSSDTSSESSDSSSDNSDTDDDIDDTKLLLEVRKQMDKSTATPIKTAIPQHVKLSESSRLTPSPEIKFSSDFDMEINRDSSIVSNGGDEEVERPSIDIRLKEQFNLKDDRPPKKKRRVGLCEEIIISPRSEEDKLQFKEDIKRYKANKEKLRKQKELIIQQTRKQLKEVEQQRKAKEKRMRTSLKVKIKDMPDFNSEASKKIKETFRANMASTVVSSLNAYRKSDCKEGRITNTEDFKHLARKLTHFVMLKEMKHISKIEDLLCTDNVKVKAREYIRKYMSKFGEVYIKRNDSPDFKD